MRNFKNSIKTGIVIFILSCFASHSFSQATGEKYSHSSRYQALFPDGWYNVTASYCKPCDFMPSQCFCVESLGRTKVN